MPLGIGERVCCSGCGRVAREMGKRRDMRDERSGEAREVELQLGRKVSLGVGAERGCAGGRCRRRPGSCELVPSSENNSRPARDVGAGFSGMAGWTPSTASQCAFHLTPAELTSAGGSGSRRYVEKSISSSMTWYSCCALLPDGIGTAWNGACGSGFGGTMTGCESPSVLSTERGVRLAPQAHIPRH
jgi:hypothetical protein